MASFDSLTCLVEYEIGGLAIEASSWIFGML